MKLIVTSLLLASALLVGISPLFQFSDRKAEADTCWSCPDGLCKKIKCPLAAKEALIPGANQTANQTATCKPNADNQTGTCTPNAGNETAIEPPGPGPKKPGPGPGPTVPLPPEPNSK
jgi:hypothetical protein